MTVFDAISDRRSIRAYRDVPVEEEKLNRVLEAGRLAPSARNKQAWRFIVVRDKNKRQALSKACCNQGFVAQAPVTLVICANQVENMRCGQNARTVDCSIALSFMVLQAAELGLGTCILGAFEEDKVRAVLAIPDEYMIVTVTPLGYPSEAVEKRPRKGLDEIVSYDAF